MSSLGQVEFNAAYDVILHHDRFSAIVVYVKNIQNTSSSTDFVQSSRNLAQLMFRPSPTKVIEQIFHIQNRFAATAIKFDHEAAKQEISQFLSSPLTYHN